MNWEDKNYQGPRGPRKPPNNGKYAPKSNKGCTTDLAIAFVAIMSLIVGFLAF